VNLFTQFAIIPIYLTHWDSEAYGLWLALQAAINIFEIFDYGHQGYLQNEFLRIGIRRRRYLRKTYWSSMLMAFVIGLVQVIIIYALCRLYPQRINATFFKGASSQYSSTIISLTLLNLIAWWLTGSCGGVTVRMMAALGYYSRFAWWAVLSAILCNIFPAIAVLFGADLWVAGLVQLAGIFIYNIPQGYIMWRLLIKDGFQPVPPDIGLALRNLIRSQYITLTSAVDQIRTQGVRLLLLPLSGARELTAFTTMRTGANVLLQGVNSVTGPLIPELMRFLNSRDQSKTEVALVSLWFLVLVALSPGMIILQVVAPAAFTWWTRGRIPFDPLLFATISLSVVVYAIAQPAVAVVQGNNRLPVRLTISIATGLCIAGGLFLLLHWIGIQGAGFALLAAEIVSAVGYEWDARRWMAANGMSWPVAAYQRVLVCLLGTAVGTALIVLQPRFTWLILALILPLQGLLLLNYWHSLSLPVRQYLRGLFQKRLFHGRQK
jgi:O-antigen/teichoic acid export membrane protein